MNETTDESLFRFTKDSYEGVFHTTLLEQYKLYVQSAENVSSRRVASSRYLLTVNAALVALYGFQSQILSLPWLALLVPILGILVSLLWHRIIASHRNLNSIKFKIIHDLEQKLPVALYTHEWWLADGGRGKRYRTITNIEQWIPLVFFVLHLILLIVFVYQFMSEQTGQHIP